MVFLRLSWCFLPIFACNLLLAQTTTGLASQAEQALHTTAASGAAAASGTPAAPPVKWTGDAVVGAQLDQGRLSQKGITATLDVWRISPVNSIRLDLAEFYGSIKPNGRRIVSLDRQYAGFSLKHKLTPRYYYMQLETIDRDKIQEISHRETSYHLIGIQLATGKRFSLDAGPGIAFCYEDKNAPTINGFQFDGGAFYSLTYKIDERWSYSHSTTLRTDFANQHETEIDSQMTLVGRITKAIGLQLKLVYNYEGVLAVPSPLVPPNTRNYLTSTVGFNYHK